MHRSRGRLVQPFRETVENVGGLGHPLLPGRREHLGQGSPES